MSDSYSAWCEERDAEAYDAEQKKIKSLLKSKKWKDTICNCNENLATAKLDVLKVCGTCAALSNAPYKYGNEQYCAVLGSIIRYPMCQKCNKWTISDSLKQAKVLQKTFNQDLMIQRHI